PIMPRRRTIVVVLLVALCAITAGLLDLTSPRYYLQTESRIRDAIARSGRTTPADPNLLFLAIDSDSVSLDETLDLQGLFSSSSIHPEFRRALEIMSKGWPWNREIYALLLERLVAAGAKVGHSKPIPNDIAQHLIRFTGPPRVGFRPRTLFEIFVPEYWEHNYRFGELIRDKSVIVGAEGKWQKDELMTPFGAMPGAEVHLNALNALLHGEFLKDLSPLARGAVTILAAVLGFGLWLRIRSPWLRLLALGAIDGAAPFFALWFYNHQNLYLPCLAPLLALNSNVLF